MIFLVAGLLGLLLAECQCMKLGLLYQYKYTGTLSTWIPNDPTHFSGSALRANVVLQRTQDHVILVKASNVEVAEHNGKSTCHVENFREYSYQQLNEDDAAFLEQPFLVYVNATAVSIKQREEPLWVTNIKRGIVNALPLVPLTGQHPPRLTFFFTEETIIGRCKNWYSLLKLPKHQSELENKKLEKTVEQDVEREGSARILAPEGKGKKTGSKSPPKSKTPVKISLPVSAPRISPVLSILTRTLDDQECEENHFTLKVNGNLESVDRTQRSSEGTFLLRGEGAVLRLERAEVDGDIVIYTGESDDEFIRITSKQVFELRAVTQATGQGDLAIETLDLTRPSFQIKSQSHHKALIEEQLTGISPTEQQIQQTLEKINGDLSALAAPVRGRLQEQFFQIFQRLVERVTVLTRTTIEEVVARTPNRHFLYQALLASGTHDAQTYLLDQMKDAFFRETNAVLVFQFFQATSITVRDPSLIPDLLNVASSMGDNETVSRTTSLLSIAKLAHQQCLEPQTAEPCDQRCNTDFIINNFLPTLSHGLKHAEKWVRLVNLQAICALGTPYSIPIIQPIIQGTNNDDIDLRINAVYCLTADLLPKTAEAMVFDSLVPLMNNPTEFPEVRSIAFLVMTTWKPSLSWWEHVAISTWKENSTQMVSFISSTLVSLSRGADFRSKYAKRVVHLARHPESQETFSLSKSLYFYLDEVATNCEAGKSLKLAWLSSRASAFPRTIFYQLQYVSVMGMTRKEKAVYFTNEIYNLYKEHNPSRWKHYEDSISFIEVFEELKEELGLSTTSLPREEPFSFIAFFEPLHFVIANLFGPEMWFNEVYIMQNLPVYQRSTDSTLAFPSDVGLPIIIKYVEDEVFSLGVEGLRSFSSGFRIQFHISHQNSLHVKTLAPWTNGGSLGAGLKTYSFVYCPLSIQTDSTLRPPNVILQLPTEKVKLLFSSSTVYTNLAPLFPFMDFTLSEEELDDNNGLKIVRTGAVQSSRNIILPASGIHLESNWLSDFEQPKDFSTYFEKMDPTLLQYNNFYYEIVVDRASSRNKNFTFIFDYDITGEQEDPSDPYQEQGSDDYLSQVSQSASSADVDFEEISSSVGFGVQKQHSQTFLSHLDRMQQQIVPRTGGKVNTFSVTINPHNSSRRYEIAIIIAVSRQRIGEKTPTKIHITFQNSPVAGSFGDTHLMCLDVRTETPYLPPLLPKEVLLETSLTSNFFINVYNERDCDGSPALKFEGYLDTDPAAMDYAQAKQMKKCDGSFPRQIQPFYDQAHFEITWRQDYQKLFTSLYSHIISDLPPVAIIDNKVPQPDNTITFDAVLNTNKSEWHMSVIGPHTTSLFLVEDDLSPIPSNIVQDYYFDIFNEDNDKVCRFTHNYVKTYDGLVHSFEPSSCWTTATMNSLAPDSSSGRQYFQAAVQIRFTDQWEARLIWPSSALILDITRSDILVNEEPFIGYSEKFVLHRLQDSQMIEAGMILIWVGDRVEIRVSDNYYGEVAGICGNYDGEPSNDMMGPKGCLYRDPSLHTIAWSTPGSGCSRFTLRAKKRELEGYRENCAKEVFQPTGVSQQNVMENCTTWEYHELTSAAGLHCKTRIPIPVCGPGCQAGFIFTKNLKYDCMLPTSGQQQQQQQQEDGNDQCFTNVMPVIIPSSCFRL